MQDERKDRGANNGAEGRQENEKDGLTEGTMSRRELLSWISWSLLE